MGQQCILVFAITCLFVYICSTKGYDIPVGERFVIIPNTSLTWWLESNGKQELYGTRGRSGVDKYGRLWVESATFDDEGYFIQITQDDVKDQSLLPEATVAYINIKGESKWNTRNQPVAVGDNIVLQCPFPQSNGGSVVWKREDLEDIKSSDTNSDILSIMDIDSDDFGRYFCLSGNVGTWFDIVEAVAVTSDPVIQEDGASQENIDVTCATCTSCTVSNIFTIILSMLLIAAIGIIICGLYLRRKKGKRQNQDPSTQGIEMSVRTRAQSNTENVEDTVDHPDGNGDSESGRLLNRGASTQPQQAVDCKRCDHLIEKLKKAQTDHLEQVDFADSLRERNHNLAGAETYYLNLLKENGLLHLISGNANTKHNEDSDTCRGNMVSENLREETASVHVGPIHNVHTPTLNQRTDTLNPGTELHETNYADDHQDSMPVSGDGSYTMDDNAAVRRTAPDSGTDQ